MHGHVSIDHDRDRFFDARLPALRTLAEPILAGVARVDTAHPAFHGCYDWHSAVHGTYALLAVARLTGDASFRDAALRAVDGVAAVRAEEAALRNGFLEAEVPYGMAWTLILDQEAARCGIGLFHDLAVLARDRLVSHVPRAGGVDDDEHANLIWPAVALGRWGRTFDDPAAVAVATGLSLPAALPTGAEGFFSPAHLAAMLLVDSGLSLPDRLLDAMRSTTPLSAVQQRTPHQAGLNFSRAWGLWAAWKATGDDDLRSRCIELIREQLAMPERWRTNYAWHSHWVPQFGVFAIAETFPDQE